MIRLNTSLAAILAFIIPLLTLPIRLSSQEREQTDQVEYIATTSSELTWEAIQLLRKQHINPPLTNQILLNGMQRLFPGQAKEMYSLVEPIKSKQDFKVLLSAALQKAKKRKETIESKSALNHAPGDETNQTVNLVNTILGTVPGGPQLVTTYESKINKQLAENRYVGIGIALRKEEKHTIIAVAFRGGPAHKAGVINDDRILEVDGKSMVGKPLGEVVMALRGPKNSEVDVVVRQPGKDKRKYRMTRGVVPISSVKGVAEKGETDWDYSFPSNPETAYLEITDITGSTAAELKNALRQIERRQYKKLILDFRNCFRADLHHLLMVADLLISGDRLGHWTDAHGKTKELKLRPTSQLSDLPMTVIASPSQLNEIKLLIAGLMAHRSARLVGQLNPAPIHIRGGFDLPSGNGRIENVYHGRATVSSLTDLQPNRSPNSSSGRFRSGARKMDPLIRQALAG